QRHTESGNRVQNAPFADHKARNDPSFEQRFSAGANPAPVPSTNPAPQADNGNMSVDAYRKKHEITIICPGREAPSPFMSFQSTGFPSEILREVQQAGFKAPSPIQAQSWPIALKGSDIVAVAKTGSGKTLGYLLPGFILVKNLRHNSRDGPTVLVLSPTRELATQIQDEAIKFGRSSRISSTCLYGGAPKGPQLRDLERGADIVVATPGRLNDILEMGKVSLRQVAYLVLDEADRMLDMGFEPQIRKIVKQVQPKRQTLMFTATWPREVRKIASDLLTNPVQVNIGNTDELVANKSITQHVEVTTSFEKGRRLDQILRQQEPGSKAERDSVLSEFRTGRCPILVATDVAARGLDVKDIRVVVNYDFPTGVEDYVHRIGRTGRAGATGIAYTFFCDQDSKYASDLVKILEGANQNVSPELRAMVGRGGYGGRGPRRWASSNDSYGGQGAYGSQTRDGPSFQSSYNNSSSGNQYGGAPSFHSSSSNNQTSGAASLPASGGSGEGLSFHDRFYSGNSRGGDRARSRSPPKAVGVSNW
uniref:RNA helicase n=1 Tax=Aegilops tauschii subsp. strangulata TaxID=200361 RepID=A0A453EBI5_AEGTS